ncbi:MAG: hypothetical protein HFJ25_06665 [Clostridia bacterium]|nr:hypothetical protein [Clostridia bacterium]
MSHRRKKGKRQRNVIVILVIGLLCIMSAGYAAFQTNLNINAKGNIKKMFAAEYLKKIVVALGDGLYKDTYEEGRYIYKGSNPLNYIKFNDEIWRIMSVESDGTLKIIRQDSIGDMVWDSSNSNDWAQPASLNTYLNSTYYDSLNNDSKKIVIDQKFSIGPVIDHNTDLATQIQSENSVIWTGKVGLISVSEFLRANTNTVQCASFDLNNANYSTCRTANYLVPNSMDSLSYWTISAFASDFDHVFFVNSSGNVYYNRVPNESSVLPVLYLKSDIYLKGSGTLDNPYIIN